MVSIDDVDDRVAQILTAGPGVTITYSDLLDALTIAAHVTPEAIDDRLSEVLHAGPGIVIDYNDAANTITITATDASEVDLRLEDIDDRVAQLLQAGPGITLNYDDNMNTLTIATTTEVFDEVWIDPNPPAGNSYELWFDTDADDEPWEGILIPGPEGPPGPQGPPGTGGGGDTATATGTWHCVVTDTQNTVIVPGDNWQWNNCTWGQAGCQVYFMLQVTFPTTGVVEPLSSFLFTLPDLPQFDAQYQLSPVAIAGGSVDSFPFSASYPVDYIQLNDTRGSWDFPACYGSVRKGFGFNDKVQMGYTMFPTIGAAYPAINIWGHFLSSVTPAAP